MGIRSTTVDFVAKEVAPDEWRLVLVEEGPWPEPVTDQLSRVQERLYGCLDAILDGAVAAKFPESKGKKIVVQLDGYNLPKAEVEQFFRRFSGEVFRTSDYARALAKNEFASDISFILNFDSIH